MLTIGCHLSSSKGYLAMGKEAVSIGANTFQFFTRNPRGGAAKAIEEARRNPSTTRMSQRFFLTVRSMESSAFWHMRRTR